MSSMEGKPPTSAEKYPGLKSSELLFKNSLPTIEDISARYPERNLPDEALVTRVAPSPTGPMHIGGLYMALLCERLAHQSGGVYFLRVEDTDKKREVEGAKELITDVLSQYDLIPDEGPGDYKDDIGSYGPYVQSERVELYQSYVRELVRKGKAYACFATEEELNQTRELQQSLSIRPGYYKQWATWRDRSIEDVKEELASGKPYVIRLRSEGNENRLVVHEDLLKGRIEMPENDLDVVLLKADGLPTYHLAHAVDDHLMGTTHVFRGDEWVPSLPLHLQLFEMLDFKKMKYGHIAPINKIDEGGGKRKLSKRKDPEASVMFYAESGYPETAVIDYMMNLANSGYEEWRIDNPDKTFREFTVTLEQLAQSRGPIFDEAKLKDIARTSIANMSAPEVYGHVLKWSKKFNEKFYSVLVSEPDRWERIFAIERGGDHARKDIARWSEMPQAFDFFLYRPLPDWNTFTGALMPSERKQCMSEVRSWYSPNLTKEEWLQQLKEMTTRYNLAPDAKTYRKERENYRGHVGELTQVLRYAVTGRLQSPDLYEVMKNLPLEELEARMNVAD